MSRAFRVYSSAHLTSNVDRVKSFAWVIKSPTKFITALPTLLCAFILSFFPSICFAAIYQENFEGQFISSGYGSIPANWTATGSSLASYSKSSEHFEGNYSLAAVVSYDSQYYAVLNRSISGLTPGKVLNISVRVKCTTSSRAEGAVGFTSGATQTSNNTVWFSSSQEWHTLQLTGVVVPSSGTLNIWLKMANDSGASTFYWDCLTIADIGSCFDTVQKAYIGYYQRPADPEGLLYWAGRLEASGGNLTDIIEAFANSQESQTLYGPINNTTISGVINAIYRALFNRDAEPGGLAWYANGFSTGQYTAATIMLNVLYGAQNDDLQSINNKLTASTRFTKVIDPELDGEDFLYNYSGDEMAIRARTFLSSVASNAATIPSEDQIKGFFGVISYNYVHILPPGWTGAYPEDINNSGQVIGGGWNPSGQYSGFLYTDGTYTTLHPWDWQSAKAIGMNAMGQVIGYASNGSGTNTEYRGFLYSNGTYTIVEPPGWSDSTPAGINNSGQVVGSGWITPGQQRGFLYSNGTYTTLLPPGWNSASANSINDNGQVVGYGLTSESGFLFSNGSYTILRPPGWQEAVAMDINNAGQVVGWGKDALGQIRGFLYSNGTYTTLLPPGWELCYAWSINDNGQVIGEGQSGGFLYSNGTYSLVRGKPQAINNDAQVTGYESTGISTANWQGFLATPK